MGLQEQGVILPSLLCMMDGLLRGMGMMLSFCVNLKSMETERCTVLEAKGEEMMRMICERSPKSTLFSSR